MKQVNIHEAKTHLSRLVDLALEGEDVVIARRKRPLVRLTVVEQEPTRRKIGVLTGLIRCMDDGFNDSLDDWSGDLVPPTGRKRPSRKKTGRS